MKYALIGCGRISKKHIEAALYNDLEIVAICDTDHAQTVEVCNKYPFKFIPKQYDDHIKMLDENPDIELVAIATPSGTHAPIAIDCINRHKHVVIEKPIALSMEDADRIIELSKEKNVCVTVCFQNRFNGALQQAKKAMLYHRLGTISHGSICVRWNRNDIYYKQALWRGSWEQDGGCLMNQCIHGIDSLLWIMNEKVESVYGRIANKVHGSIECEDVGMAVIKFANGIIATIEGTVNVYPKNLESKLSVFGEKGTIQIGGNNLNKVELWKFEKENNDDKAISDIFEASINEYGNGHAMLYSDVIEAICNKTNPYISAEEGKNAIEVILAIYESCKTNSVIQLPLNNVKTLDFVGMLDK